MNYGSKFVNSVPAGAPAGRMFAEDAGKGRSDSFIDDALVEASGPATVKFESHGERISSFIAELDTITKHACEAARQGAEHADRMEERLLQERAVLRSLLVEKVESVVGLELALAHLQHAAKGAVGEFQRRISVQESQLEEQRIELQQLRSGRDYLTSRIDETLVAAETARVEALRMKERWQSDAVAHRLQVAEYEQWLVEKNRRLEKLESEAQTTIDDLTLRLRQTEEQLASRAAPRQPNGKVASAGFITRAQTLEPPRATLQAARKTQRAS